MNIIICPRVLIDSGVSGFRMSALFRLYALLRKQRWTLGKIVQAEMPATNGCGASCDVSCGRFDCDASCDSFDCRQSLIVTRVVTALIADRICDASCDSFDCRKTVVARVVPDLIVTALIADVQERARNDGLKKKAGRVRLFGVWGV